MFRTVAALIALIAVLTAPPSAALGDTFKICMHSSGSPSCAGDEIALGFDDFVSQFGANLGAPEQQEAIAHRFCKIDGADGKTTMRPHNVVYYAQSGGQHGTGHFVISCQ